MDDIRTSDENIFAFFTRDEVRLVEALAGRIFPDDELGPGAVAAGVVRYIDRALSGAERDRQLTYREALKRIDGVSRHRHGRPFAACAAAEQDALIGDLAADRLPEFGVVPSAGAFFEMLRAHVLEGMFSDPAHGGNRDFAGWKLLGYWGPVPGYSHEEQQIDAVIKRDRFHSAADYPLPPKDKA